MQTPFGPATLISTDALPLTCSQGEAAKIENEVAHGNICGLQ